MKTKPYTFTTITQVREAFWHDHPQFASKRRARKRQNAYCCDIRVAFCDYADFLRRSGLISPNIANRVTL